MPSPVAGDPLTNDDAATTAAVRDGRTLITDGPFVETRGRPGRVAAARVPVGGQTGAAGELVPLADGSLDVVSGRSLGATVGR